MINQHSEYQYKTLLSCHIYIGKSESSVDTKFVDILYCSAYDDMANSIFIICENGSNPWVLSISLFINFAVFTSTIPFSTVPSSFIVKTFSFSVTVRGNSLPVTVAPIFSKFGFNLFLSNSKLLVL